MMRTVAGIAEQSIKIPDTPSLTGFFAPSGVEAEVPHLPVIAGEVPSALDRAFYRVAPDPQFPPHSGDDIWVNGDEIAMGRKADLVDTTNGLMMDTPARIDRESGEQDSYWVCPVSSPREPAFITPPGSDEERDGYPIVLENRMAEMESCWLPFRIRRGLHGDWHRADRIGA